MIVGVEAQKTKDDVLRYIILRPYRPYTDFAVQLLSEFLFYLIYLQIELFYRKVFGQIHLSCMVQKAFKHNKQKTEMESAKFVMI